MAGIDGECAESGISLCVLGPLECRSAGGRLPLGGPQQERLLVTLALAVNRVVPVPRLVDAVWDGEPPATAAHQIRKMAGDLRRRIPDGPEVLLTEGAGYRLALGEEQLDLSLFHVRLRRAREAAAAGLRENAAEQLRAGLDLWRGPVLGGAGGPVLAAAVAELEELRLAACEELAVLRLELGAGADLIGELRRLVAEHPLRERLRGLLMRALYRAARQAEALEEYRRIRDLLGEELGIDPGPELERLHGDILRASPDLFASPSPVPPAPAAPLVPAARPAVHSSEAPCSLPYDLPDFTGRGDERERLIDMAAPGARVKIISLEGMGGCGKTTLAVRTAHAVSAHYPDGQLWIDLGGFTPGQLPLDPSVALDVLLRTVGVPGERIPDGLLARISLWRVTTANRRLLVLLDNACSAEQVQPLLPAAPGSLVLITSRVRLSELDGAQVVPVDVMSPDDSRQLLVRALGEERVAAEPRAVDELIDLCGRLPLALRICAGRLVDRPGWSLQHMVDRLGTETRRLRELRGGSRSVEAGTSLSYLAMGPELRFTFRMLGCFPGYDFDVHAAAALVGVSPDEAADQLEQLVDVNLLRQPTEGRYSFHDLVRAYARSVEAGADGATAGAAEGGPGAASRAVERLLDHYHHTLSRASERLYPGKAAMVRADGPDPQHAPGPDLPDAEAARGWLAREFGNVIAGLRQARKSGLHWHAAVMPRYLSEFLQLYGYLEESLEVAEIAAQAAEDLGDPVVLRLVTSNLSVALWNLGRFQEGLRHADRALELARELGDPAMQAACLRRIGTFHNYLGDYAEGLAQLDEALELTRRSGAVREQAATLVSISSAAGYLGRYQDSADSARQAIELYRELGELQGETLALVNLANSRVGCGDPDGAVEHLEAAWNLAQSRRTRTYTALVASRFTQLQLLRGSRGEAKRWEAVVRDSLWAETGPSMAVRLHNVLGAAHHSRGEYAEALHNSRTAYNKAQRIGYRIGLAEAMQGIAESAERSGGRELAEQMGRRARELFSSMGVPVGHVRMR
ncbi:BTAD domain-containing putative transcriptional regulator [Streptomyces sp. NPDC001380]|uniref:AfsR/SARP family transcriptional regulator n=1 Tax=Streptomyces sp. NPDC001380 TaxID=3364566 RepID=UPI0036ABD221